MADELSQAEIDALLSQGATSANEAEEPEPEKESEPGYTILPEGMHLAIVSKWDKKFRLYNS